MVDTPTKQDTPSNIPLQAQLTEQPLFVIKPKFEGHIILLRSIPIYLFFIVWGTGFFGGFGMVIFSFFSFIISFIFFSFVVPILFYILTKRNYKKIEYRFFNNRLEYWNGFWNVSHNYIDYQYITSVNYIKGVLQKKYDLGTITLNTPSVTIGGIIHIVDIENPDNIYQQVRKLIESHRGNVGFPMGQPTPKQ